MTSRCKPNTVSSRETKLKVIPSASAGAEAMPPPALGWDSTSTLVARRVPLPTPVDALATPYIHSSRARHEEGL